MAYKLNEQRITPGGLDLLVPADQNPRRASLTDLVNVPQGECLDLTDWFAGSDGRLEQAPQPTLASSPLATGAQNSLLSTAGRTYYSDGIWLRQVGRDGADGPLNGTALDGFPLGMIAFQGFAWIMNTVAQYRDDGTTLWPWTVAAPTNAPGLTDLGTSGAPGINGGTGAKLHAVEDNYRVTWVTSVGETNPSPSNLLTPAVDNSSTQITQPTGAPACATGWNIYRQVPGYGGTSLDGDTTPYLLNPSPIPIAQTTYVDTGNTVDDQDDTSLLLLGVIMEADHDPAPAARVLAQQVYNGRIIAANSAQYPNRIWWTDPLEPAFFPGSADTYDGNWADIGTDRDDAILAITVRPGFLTIYRQKSIWVHLGDCGSSTAIIEVAVPECGTVGPRAVCSTSASDYFTWVDGVYAFNNDAASKLSFKVDPIWRGLTSENFPQLGTAYRSQCAIGHRNGRLYCSYPTTAGVMAMSLVLHLPTGRWFSHPFGWLCFLDTGQAFLACAAGGVFTLESAYSATTSALAFESQYHDCGLPDREKTWADLVLQHNTQGATLSVVCRTNKNGGTYGTTPPAADSFTLATFSSTSLTKQIFPLVYPSTYTVTALRGQPIKSFNLAIRITGNGAGGSLPAVVESPILLHYYLEARFGLSWDSGPTNHGLEGVGRIDQLEIDCDTSECTAGVQSTLYCDIPGGILGNGFGFTIPQSTGRQILRVVLATPQTGRLFRHMLGGIGGNPAPAAPFAIYEYKVRILPIGVYADGAQEDFWYTLPIAPGEQSGQ